MSEEANAVSTDEGRPAGEGAESGDLHSELRRVYDQLASSEGDETSQDIGEDAAEDAEEAPETEEAEAESEASDGSDTSLDDEEVELSQSFSSELREWFSTLDKEGQRIVGKRLKEQESGFEKRMEKLSAKEKSLDALNQTLEPYREQFALQGVDEATAVKQLLAANQFLQAQPVEAIKWLAQSAGVDLSQLSEAPAEQEYVDPQVSELKEEINSLKGILAQFQGQQQQQTTAAVQTQIQEFATRTDADGNVLHPYFDRVREQMGRLMQTGQAESLDQAYETAIWANPEIRSEMLAKERSAVEQARKSRIAKATKQKEVTSSPAASSGAAPKTIRDELAEQLDRFL